MLGRLQHDGASGCQGRSPFPCLHEQRKVPGDDLPDHADGLVTRVAEIVTFHGNRLAVSLVGPAGIVTVALDGQRQVGGDGITVRLAVVEAFQGGKFFLVFLDEVGQAVQVPAALGGIHLRPGARLKRLAGRLDGQINVRLVSLGHLTDGFTRGRVNGWKSLAGGAIDPLTADKHRPVFDLGRFGRGRLLAGHGCHAGILLCNKVRGEGFAA